jgi:transposase-like protein
MKKSTPRDEYVERTIRRCALEFHQSGELRLLADEMGVSPQVFSYWWKKARWLEARFPGIASAKRLSPQRCGVKRDA